MTEVSAWSSTAASNNSAPPAGFPEGMFASDVNDSAREVMAAVHKFYERTCASVASTGSANAYVVAYSVAPSAYVTGEIYAWRANFANTGPATANVNALGAKTIKRPDGNDLAANDIRNGMPVMTTYDGTNLVLLSLPGWTLTAAAITMLASINSTSATALSAMTAAGAALLDDADAAAQRTTMSAALDAVFTGDSGAGGVKGLVPAPAAGDAAAGKLLKADGSWTANAGLLAASQAQMEAASSNTVAATPGTTVYHPGVCKCWAVVSGYGTTIKASYNVTSITDNGTGDLTVTIANDFSSANYAIVTMASYQGAIGAMWVDKTNRLAGSFRVNFGTTGTYPNDPTDSDYHIACFGDQ